MFKSRSSFLLYLLFPLCCAGVLIYTQCQQPQRPIYANKSFKVYSNRVEQGAYIATALSPIQIESNYKIGIDTVQISDKKIWKQKNYLPQLPTYKCNQLLVEALYNLSLEEAQDNITPQGFFDTGAQWKGVWTRDISYSVALALAITHPSISKASLMKKVKNGRIVQDTGTGGSWPISSDRMVWTQAAWEIYKVTGDKHWLQRAFAIIKKNTDDDLNVVWDFNHHLFKGESSFLDWREQSYPKWMQPVDIHNSLCLSTQAIHYQNLKILSRMGQLLGKDTQKYKDIAQALQKSINEKFWLPEKRYYGQYLYGRNHYSLSDKSDALGEALAVLFDIPNTQRSAQIVAHTPVLDYGTPCFYPQIKDITPYHNNAIWPFVQSFWNWSAAKAGNEQVLVHGIASQLRASALFLTNKENMVGSNGDPNGTAINSDRQLWSVAGTLSTIYRIFMGLRYKPDHLEFAPFVPWAFKGKQRLLGLKYRKATLDIQIIGFGRQISRFTLDGKPLDKPVIPATLKGHHQVSIELSNTSPIEASINIKTNRKAPSTPKVEYKDNRLQWAAVSGAVKYLIYRDGVKLYQITDTVSVNITPSTSAEYQVRAVNDQGDGSFLSDPIEVMESKYEKFVQAEFFTAPSTFKAKGYMGNGFVMLSRHKNQPFNFYIRATRKGRYLISFRYANGSGPLNTDNKCAIRTLWVNKNFKGAVVFPQRGKDNWSNWGYTNSWEVNLRHGVNKFSLTLEPYNRNMNEKINKTLIDQIRIVRTN